MHISQMQSVFIRHNMSVDPTVLKWLWDNRFIALHYKDVPSINPGDYDTAGKNALKRLLSYCSEGVIVGADFRRLFPNKMLLGKVKRGSRIKARSFTDSRTGNKIILKIVKLTQAKEISYHQYPMLAAIQPRQTTITGWASAGPYLKALVTKVPLPFKESSLHPGQLEVLCYEYLRGKGLIKCLLAPIGRSLRDVDIFGFDKKRRIVLAQVTQSSNHKAVTEKIKNLLSYRNGDTKLYLFSPSIPASSLNDFTFVPIEKVFLELSCLNKPLLRMMIYGKT